MAKIATISVPGAKALYSKTVLDSNFSAVNNNFLNFLHLGGTSEASNSMLGDLDMGGKEVINSVAPSAPGSLATKGYVDQTLTIGSTTGTIGSLVVDADGDTKVDTESSADIDRLDLLAATSAGGSAGIRIVGDDTLASSLANPNIEIKKHVVLDADVRIGDAVAANTYIELTDTSSPDTIFMVAGGNAVLDLSSTTILASQHIEMAVGKRVGDLDNDTYIEFNQVSDDDTVRIFAGGVEQVTITASTVTIGVDSVPGNFAVGGSVNPTGATKAIQMITGTSATTAADLTDNQVSVYSTVVSGIENKLNFDFKFAGPLRKTVVLGNDCVFPNDVNISNDLTVTGDVAPATLSGTIGGTPTINTVWVFSGATSFTGLPVFSGVSGLSTNNIVERTSGAGVIIDGLTIKDAGFPTGGTAIRKPMGVIHVNSTVVGNVGAGEDDLMSFTVPANTLDVNDQVLRVTAYGDFDSGAVSKKLTFHFGASSIIIVSTTVANTAWFAEALVIRTGASAQKLVIKIQTDAFGSPEAFAVLLSATEDNSTNTILKFTGENLTDTQNDKVTQELMVIEHLN